MNINHTKSMNFATFLSKKQPAISAEKIFLEENNPKNNKNNKSQKILSYGIPAVTATAIGALHGVYKKKDIEFFNWEQFFEPGVRGLLRIKLRKETENIEKGKIGVRLKKLHKGSICKIVDSGETIPETIINTKLVKVKELLKGKPPRGGIIIEKDVFSFFKKVINPAEAKLLNKLKSIKFITPLIKAYNKSDKILKSLFKDYYYNKGLVLKGAGVGLAFGALTGVCLDKILSEKSATNGR